jgi:hypothetical protein
MSPISLDLRDTILALKDEKTKESVPNALLVTQLADKVVEILGARGQHLVLHLSAVSDDQPSPRDDIESLAAAITLRVPESFRESTTSYLRTALNSALRGGHGALVAVTEGSVPPELADSVPFDVPLNLLNAVEAHSVAPDADTLGRLLAYNELLHGVLATDGISVFSTDARLLVHNAFVQQRHDAAVAPRTLVGGARRRAYEVLRGLVEEQKLYAAFIRSVDGIATLYTRSI